MTILASRVAVALAGAAMLVGSLTGCGSSSSGGTGKSFAYCTDPSDPPAESYQVARRGNELAKTLVGSDIDIGRAVAKQMGATAVYHDVPFAQLIDSLKAKKCDAVIAFMNNTAERRKQVSFVNYMSIGQSALTLQSGPSVHNIADLAGRTVSVAVGTTEEEFLKNHNMTNTAKPISIKPFTSENEAIYALQKGKVDAYFGDTPVVISAAANNKAFVVGAELVKAIPIGIAMRPDDSRIPTVRKAVSATYQDGAMGNILSKWQLGRFALNSTG